MKPLQILMLMFVMTGCGVEVEPVTPQEETPIDESASGSFRMGNREIREEMVASLKEHGVRYWINDDGSLGYYLVDGEIIDTLGNEIILAYIRRN